MSGALDDGTVGLRSIARAGGTTIVQSDATFESMPQNALAASKPGQHLQELVREIESAIRASSLDFALAGDPWSPDAGRGDGSVSTALVRAEERIALLQRLALKADAGARDPAVALKYLSALERSSERLRLLMSRQRVWSYKRPEIG